jgi:hypothetical protein
VEEPRLKQVAFGSNRDRHDSIRTQPALFRRPPETRLEVGPLRSRADDFGRLLAGGEDDGAGGQGTELVVRAGLNFKRFFSLAIEEGGEFPPNGLAVERAGRCANNLVKRQ